MLQIESLKREEEREQRIEDLTIEIEELQVELWKREDEYQGIVGELEREEYDREGPIGRTPTEHDDMYLERREELEEEVLPYLESLLERKKEELKKLKSLEERELQKTIEIEMPEPIEIELPEPIEIPSHVKIKKDGSVMLKNKVIRTTKGYLSRKLPNEKKDLEGWKRVRREKLGASDLVKMVNPRYESGIIDLLLERLHNQEKVFSTEAQEKMGIGKFLEECWHTQMAAALYTDKKVVLGEYTFSEVFLSKNRQYINTSVEALASQLDAWGICEGVKTILECKTTSSHRFPELRQALEAGQQEALKREKPEYYYQLQAQMLCTGFSQALIYIKERNNCQSFALMIQEDLEAQEWIKRRVREFEKALRIFRGQEVESLRRVLENSLGEYFSELHPSESLKQAFQTKELRKLERLIENNRELKQELVSYIETQKNLKKTEGYLTRKYRFMAEERKFLLRSETLKQKIQEEGALAC